MIHRCYIDRRLIRNWLTWLRQWKPRSPKTWSQQAGHTGEREPMVWILVQVQVPWWETHVTAWRQSGRENKFSDLTFYSIQVFSGLSEFHPHWRKQSALLSLPIQMLILFKNTFTDTPSLMYNQISTHPVTKWSWHIKLFITATQAGTPFSSCFPI